MSNRAAEEGEEEIKRPHIPDRVVLQLCINSGGRCEYEGCNTLIWKDPLSYADVNVSYVAHIVGVGKKSARYDSSCSAQLATELSNLMLMCDSCHRRVDTHERDAHPRAVLESMKEKHEARIRIATGIAPNKRTKLLSYLSVINSQTLRVSFAQAGRAVVPGRLPWDDRIVALGTVNTAHRASDPEFWKHEEASLRGSFDRLVRQQLDHGEYQHVSVFAGAPQPLLILLGTLLSDITSCDVFQPKREGVDSFDRWKWDEAGDSSNTIRMVPPEANSGPPALLVNLSANVPDEDVLRALPRASIWRITCDRPGNDMLRTPAQLSEFRKIARTTLDSIKMAHGATSELAVFPVMPIATCVELGRVHQPKADLSLRIFDRLGPTAGFVEALTIEIAP